MDAVKFAKTMRKICRTHTNCIECEFMKVQGHCGIMNPETDHAEMVAVAEQWEREHVEKDTEEESRNLLELMVALTDKVDRLEEKIKAAESMIEGSRRVTDAAFGKVDEQFAEMVERIALCMWENSGAGKAKKKRTNKDALLAAFPNTRMDNNGIPDICPLALVQNYNNCNDFASCSVCKCAYWLAEVEE